MSIERHTPAAKDWNADLQAQVAQARAQEGFAQKNLQQNRVMQNIYERGG